MAKEVPATIEEALEGVTDESLGISEDEDAGEETTEETTEESTEEADEDDADGGDDDESEEESDDESDDESDESDDEEDSEEEDADWEVGNEASEEEEDTDFFDEVTPEQLAKIKKHPELNALRKQLMKGFEKKTTQHANLVKLGEAYKKNPLGVLQAIADQLGVQVVKRGDASTPAAGVKAESESKVAAAAKRLEKLFGDNVGPAVREALNEFVDAVTEEKLSPVTTKLSKADAAAEQAQFLQEESDFRTRHAKVLTPEIENEVVKLGESGKIIPGKGMGAGEFLDTLLEIVLAKRGQGVVKAAGKKAAERLREKVEKNRRNREPRGRGGKSGVKKVSRLERDPGSFRSLSDAIDAAAAEIGDDFED